MVMVEEYVYGSSIVRWSMEDLAILLLVEDDVSTSDRTHYVNLKMNLNCTKIPEGFCEGIKYALQTHQHQAEAHQPQPSQTITQTRSIR